MKIKKAYLAKYEGSQTTEGNINDRNSFRAKYLSKTGIVLIIKNYFFQYFRFHPLKDEKIDLSKGLESSPDEYYVADGFLVIETMNSIYKFRIIKELTLKELNNYLE